MNPEFFVNSTESAVNSAINFFIKDESLRDAATELVAASRALTHAQVSCATSVFNVWLSEVGKVSNPFVTGVK